MKKFLLLFAMCFAFVHVWAQERTVSGKVTSAEDGTALPGVNVILQGTSTGAVTDIDGFYSLSVPSEGGTLVFSFIGLASQEIQIGQRSVIDLQMEADVTQLSEVVVVGYGSILKKELTGAVSSIKEETIKDLPVVSAQEALQGLTSGVFVTSNSGAPGGGISVRVRGQTSINASNQPLYIVDGVIVSADNFQLAGYGGQGQNALAGVSVDDISSIEVLKDAASTAIYGARAANGVVLITTKSGKKGKPSINLEYWTGFSQPTNTYDLLTAPEYIEIKNEAYNRATGLGPRDNSDWGWDGTTSTDWMKEVFRTARTNNYQLNFSGGSDAITYYISGGHRNEEGTMIGSSLKRYNGRLNFTIKATENLEIGTKTSVNVDQNNRLQNDNNIYGIYSASILTPPTKPIYDENGEFVDALPSFNTNAVRDALLPKYLNSTRKLISNTYVSYEILDGLQFRTDFNYDYTYFSEEHFEPVETAQGRSSNGYGLYSNVENGRYMFEPTLRYNTILSEDHSLNAILGTSWQETNYTSNWVEGTGFARSSLQYLTSAATINGGSSYNSKYSFQSIFGRVGYSFNEKYILSATVRRDGSSRFGENRQYGLFYAFSAGWNFIDESFMESVDFLSFGKIRASYGITGNDAIGNFQYLGTWSGSANYLDQPANAPSNIANPELQWEETRNIDFGLDLGFLEDRFNLSIGYFHQLTNNLLYGIPIPYTTGFGSYTGNLGEMENKGFEFDLSATLFKTTDFSATVSGNISFLQNKVVSIVNEAPVLSGFGSAIIEGYPINSFYLVNFLGVDPATGNSIFEDYNGDGIINSDDSYVVGDYSPDMLGGFTGNITYKGLSLNAIFQFVEGVDIYNNTLTFSSNPAANWGMTTNMLDRWQQPGDITEVPAATTGPTLDQSLDNTRWLSDGSYLRLKNLTLAYDLPKTLISKIGLNNLRVFATGQNILTWTRYEGADPEISTFADTNTAQGTEFLTWPQSKTLLFGINVGF